MPNKLIHSGTIITASEIIRADLLVEDEKIVAIGTDIPPDAHESIDAEGKFILPGGVDPHNHFDLPMFDTVSSDDHYTGHKAAAFGGTTTVIDFVPQDYASLKQAVDAWHEKADGKAAVDFGFHMNITQLNDEVEAQIPDLISEGITTLKVFTAYNGRLRLQDGEIFRVMRVGAEHGMLTMLHAENGDVIDVLTKEALAAGHTDPEWHAQTRPAWGAVESVLRGIALAQQAGAPLYVVHLNTAGGLEQIQYGRARGVAVMAETCPQYLFFTEDNLRSPEGAKWICSPPLRGEDDNIALWCGIADGSIQALVRTTAPSTLMERRRSNMRGQKSQFPGRS